MERHTSQLRALLRSKTFLHMPSVYDAIGGRLVQSLGYETAHIGGYVTGGSSAVTEPLLTMTEQVRLAGDVAQSIGIPLVADAGAGFGEPLHTMRTVREFIRVGVAGIHQSRGNRDGRPIFSRQELQQMGYVGCIEAQVVLCTAFHFLKQVLAELRDAGSYRGMTEAEYVVARQAVEDLIGLDDYYAIEEQTVEARQSG